MQETVSIWLSDAKKTHSAGASLAASIYGSSLTIGLSGELGAGKTTFLKGLLGALGVDEHVVSPTYALEQRYQSCKGEILHIDLYRLSEAQAKELVGQSDDHEGLRCIEWVERCPSLDQDIAITLSEEDRKEGRNLMITFDDMNVPTTEEIQQWREELRLPSHIQEHCDAVAALTAELADSLLLRGTVVRKDAVVKAALVHDLLRFVDFHEGSSHMNQHVTEKDESVWQSWKEKFADMEHERACAEFLRERGFRELGMIVEVHGLKHCPKADGTIEQKLLYYADKRVMLHTRCTLDERFEDLANRYASGKITDQHIRWLSEAKTIEAELIGSTE